MKIYLKQLTLRNFKGIRSQAITFNEVTDIYGQNGSGKTTIMDAFLWLMFGKDSSDRVDFEIKTLDENNEPFHKLDHEVTAIMSMNGDDITISRIFREKWVKKRGEKDSEFTGHEQSFFWNDVPLKESEFKAKVASLVDEKVFKLLTNVQYFSSLKWQDRRNTLLSIAGDISNTDILNEIEAGNNPAFKELIKALNAKKSIKEFKDEITAKKKKLRDELEVIPHRIDEANNSLPDKLDYKSIEKELAEVTSEIENIDALLESKTKAARDYQDKITAKIREVGQLRNQLISLENDIKNQVLDSKISRESDINERKRQLRSKEDELTRLRNDLTLEERNLKTKEQLAAEFRTKWSEIDKETFSFDESKCLCPTCKRQYDATDIESSRNLLQKNFNTDKVNRLTEVIEKGKSAANDITVYKAKIDNIKASGISLKGEVDQLKADISELEQNHNRLCVDENKEVIDAIGGSKEHKAINSKIDTLNEEINTPLSSENNAELKARKVDASNRAIEIRNRLSTKDQREKVLARIEELSSKEKTMAQELADLEGVEFSIEQFVKAKMDTLESRINDRFSVVKFKMFEQQINGSQVEACTTLINGVPYSDANTASKIAAGLDIINVLSDHYDVTAPIFIDNRESVTSIPESKSQIINLIVSPKHKVLTVQSAESAAVA
jgi:exonuclease SbcC